MDPKTVFDSPDEMLAPASLSQLLEVPVSRVSRRPLEAAHFSGNELDAIVVESDVSERRLILKRFQPARDWVMRLTHDSLTREAMLFVHGIYERMPTGVEVPTIAASRCGETWATLMQDVSPHLVPANQQVTESEGRVAIKRLAAIHAKFRENTALENPALGLSSLYDFVTILSPARVQSELDGGRAHPVLELAARGWKQFYDTAPTDVCKIVRELQDDPTPLLTELELLPQTLLHGDFKLGHLGIVRTRTLQYGLPEGAEKVIVLDWQDATRGAGVLDLGFFLALSARWLPIAKGTAVQFYADSLALYGHSVSHRELEIGMVAGGALRLLWSMALNQPSELEWWYDLIRRFKS